MPSNHLILCHSLLLLPSIFPSIRVFSNESVLCIRWPKYQSFSFNISPSNEYSGLISFRMDWVDILAAQGTLKSLLQHHSSKASILPCSAFFIIQLSHPYMTTGKTIVLTTWTFIRKVMPPFFNMLSQFSSVAQLCPTLRDPMNCSTPGLPAHHQLPEFTQTHMHQVSDAIQPSQPLSSPSPPAPNPSQSTLRMRWPKYWSFCFSIIPSKEIPGLISFRMDWLDLLAVQGTLKGLLQHHSSKASILWHSAFFMVQLSHPYMTTEKTIALPRWTFLGNVSAF